MGSVIEMLGGRLPAKVAAIEVSGECRMEREFLCLECSIPQYIAIIPEADLYSAF